VSDVASPPHRVTPAPTLQNRSTPGGQGGTASLRVWILQPRVEHYNTPVFDGVRERGVSRGSYALTVLGTLQDGKAFGGYAREYFRSCPLEGFKRFGVSLFRWPSAMSLLERERPDVLVVEANPRNTTTWQLPRFCRRLGIPIVGWSKIHSYSMVAPLMGLVKPSFYRGFDRVICYGASSSRELVSLGYPADRIDIANNTIDTRRIFTQGDEIRARGEHIRREHALVGKRILLCIGRMDPEKRHQDLLDAWPRLRALDPNLVMVLVGGGALLERVRTRAAAIDRHRIVVTGRVPEGDDYAWIAASDVCVYPGAVGLAINQSLALGRPTVIANERGADTEILIGGGPEQTGWRFRRGDLDDMARMVRQVLERPAEVASVSERARVLMRDHVTLENMIGAIDDSIQKAIDQRSSRTARGSGEAMTSVAQ
jgi:glycosyltransferase involved in cell wall biosynthesis